MIPRASQLILAVALALAGCVTMPAGDRPSATLEGRLLTRRELRVRLYDFVVRFASGIESAADAIAAGTDSPDVRERALLLKTNAVPACESAAFDADPAVGLVDVWTLVARLDDYFGSELAVEDFRDQAAVGRALLDSLADGIESVALELEGPEEFARLRGQVHAFAAAHPLDGPRFTPAADLPVLDLAQRASGDSLLELAASADDRLAEAQDRLTIYAASLPRQARWQAELMAERLLNRAPVTDLVALAADLPTLVADERAALVETVAAERAALVAAADTQRLDTLAFARAEREATLAAVDEQRVATLEALAGERVAILADVDRQRVETLAHLRSERELLLQWMSAERNASIDYASGATTHASERLLGRAFLYATLLVSIPALLLAVAVLVCRPKLSLDLSRRPRA